MRPAPRPPFSQPVRSRARSLAARVDALGDGGAQSIENSTISEMEILEYETPRFDEKFVKVNSSSHFF